MTLSVEEYLRTSYEPNCEYVYGAIVQKPWPMWNHSSTQGQVLFLIHKAFPVYDALPELTLLIGETLCLIPDVTVDRCDRRQDPYPTSPVHLCIEIVSPDDRLSALFSKCETYHAWGTAHTWVIDPETRRAWQYTKGDEPREVEELLAGDIHVNVADVFATL